MDYEPNPLNCGFFMLLNIFRGVKCYFVQNSVYIMAQKEEVTPDPLDSFTVIDPFSLVKHIPKELACNFFGVFSRFEFALKEAGFKLDCRGVAQADWFKFAESVDNALKELRSATLESAVEFIIDEPPKVQSIDLRWVPPIERPHSRYVNSIFHIKQVRNNLFHGGKHPPSKPERDIELIENSLVILKACLMTSYQVNEHYVTTEF